jgi:hypothetical protein
VSACGRGNEAACGVAAILSTDFHQRSLSDGSASDVRSVVEAIDVRAGTRADEGGMEAHSSASCSAWRMLRRSRCDLRSRWYRPSLELLV